jgi:hypothetical protein
VYSDLVRVHEKADLVSSFCIVRVVAFEDVDPETPVASNDLNIESNIAAIALVVLRVRVGDLSRLFLDYFHVIKNRLNTLNL